VAHDLVIRGGSIIDGTGRPAFAGDVAIRAGRIAELGRASEAARREFDASGCWVTPGFIDPHTHLDAQLCWDGSASPSPNHGVTTVVIGLCGFGVAPCAAGGGEYLLRSLERVEEIPYACTREGVPFAWSGWAEYLEFLAKRPLGVNVAGFVPHSALRCFAMGERARGEVASADERAAMLAELRRALAAGALGFATSRGPNHVDGFGAPVPSRFADDLELQALVGACGGRVWQINVEAKFGSDPSALTREVERYADWSRGAGARLTWSPLHAERGNGVWQQVLVHNRALKADGAIVAPQVAALPIDVLLRFDEPSFLVHVGGWERALDGFFARSRAERLALLADPRTRAALKATDPGARFGPRFEEWWFAHSPARPERVGTSVAAAAASAGVHPVDLLCEQVIADELATLLQVSAANRDPDGVRSLIGDPDTLLALGDAGAHVMSVTNYRYPTFLLAECVLKQSSLPLEQAVRRMTSHPARFHGLAGRGELRVGEAADVCVIDPQRLALEPVRVARDLPGAAPRLYQGARGYRAVLVGGVPLIEDDRPTGAAAGGVLRASAG
jgi:N-acyl-D-aspartate/D-glutamate deacylase